MSHSLYLVAGLGKTGLSIARYLKRKCKSFVAFDTREDAPLLSQFKNEFPQISVYFQTVPKELLNQVTDIIASPGVPLDTPLLKQAKLLSIPVYGDIECLAREINAPVVAITGTNGKSTVTTLVGEMAKAAGFSVAVAGNIGSPVLDMLNDGHQYDLWVLELSSFQLDLTFSLTPAVATILNITPDHLDRHHCLEAYVAAKQRVYHQAKTVLFNRDDTNTFPAKGKSVEGHSISYGQDAPTAENWGIVTQEKNRYLAKGSEFFFPVESLLVKGIHNWLNALAASALAQAVSIPMQSVLEVLKTFKGLPHRCQWVRTLEDVTWINDSKGTNVGATISAINGIGGTMQGKIVLIAGGQGKGADFQNLTPFVSEFVRSIVLIGEDADKIQSTLAPVVPIARAISMESAVVMAKNLAKPGDVVLLSPACASFDMFRDFNHRGEVFAAAVNGL